MWVSFLDTTPKWVISYNEKKECGFVRLFSKNRAVNLSNLFTGLRKLSLEEKKYFSRIFFFFCSSLPKLQKGFWAFFPGEQRLVHAVTSLLISVVVWEGLTQAVLCGGCSCPHVWFNEVLSKVSTANVSGLVIFTHRPGCFRHRQCAIGFEGGLWVPYR